MTGSTCIFHQPPWTHSGGGVVALIETVFLAVC